MRNILNLFKKHDGLITEEHYELEDEYTKQTSKTKSINKTKNKKKKEITEYNDPSDFEYNYDTLTEDDYFDISTKKKKKLVKRYLIVLFSLIFLICLDTILVTKFEVGPFFAIRTKVYDDGGTKEYHGLGYKVIKYNQDNGRVDTVIGLWDLTYQGTPTKLTMTELTLNLINDKEKTYQEIYREYIEITDEIYEINIEAKEIAFIYKDENQKYELRVLCDLTDKSIFLNEYSQNQSITYNGIVDSYKENKDTPNELVLKNCNIKSE